MVIGCKFRVQLKTFLMLCYAPAERSKIPPSRNFIIWMDERTSRVLHVRNCTFVGWSFFNGVSTERGRQDEVRNGVWKIHKLETRTANKSAKDKRSSIIPRDFYQASSCLVAVVSLIIRAPGFSRTRNVKYYSLTLDSTHFIKQSTLHLIKLYEETKFDKLLLCEN